MPIRLDRAFCKRPSLLLRVLSKPLTTIGEADGRRATAGGPTFCCEGARLCDRDENGAVGRAPDAAGDEGSMRFTSLVPELTFTGKRPLPALRMGRGGRSIVQKRWCKVYMSDLQVVVVEDISCTSR
jgi:hypothetical protein